MSITIYGRDKDSTVYFRVAMEPTSLRNEYAPVSCGIVRSTTWIKRMVTQRKATIVTKDEWNHSGCQSSCIRRGGQSCRW